MASRTEPERNAHPARILRWAAVTGAVLALTTGYFGFVDGRVISPYRDSFPLGDMSEWRTYGGSWVVNDGVLDNLGTSRGDKALVGSSRWTDYVVETDLRLNADPADSLWGDAGVVLRATNAALGVDSYDGYYVGIGSEGSVLLLGRANYSWNRLSAVPLPVAVRPGSWFHLRAMAKGCYFEATAEDLASGLRAQLTYFDRDCTKHSGATGVRSYGMPASWRSFRVYPPDH